MTKSLFLTAVSLWLVGCLTPKKERRLNADIYNLQQRTFELEKRLLERSDDAFKSSGTNKKKIAATASTLEKFELEMQKLRGEIDVLRVGVRTGQIPGEEVEAGTLAATINDIQERLEAVEETQSELLSIIRSGQKNNGKKDESKSASVGSISDLEELFDKKLYPQVIQLAPDLAKKVKKKANQERVTFLHAESLYKLGKLRDAALKFNDFLDRKPSAKHLVHAKLRMGDCFRHLGDTATSRVYYTELINEFPDSEQAELAQRRLEKLKKRG